MNGEYDHKVPFSDFNPQTYIPEGETYGVGAGVSGALFGNYGAIDGSFQISRDDWGGILPLLVLVIELEVTVLLLSMSMRKTQLLRKWLISSASLVQDIH